MNTHTIRCTTDWRFGKNAGTKPSALENWIALTPLQRACRIGFRLLVSMLPAVMMVVAAAWATGAVEKTAVLQAMVWASGFVFLALATESEKSDAGLLVATGFTLPVLALLSAQVAVEFAVLAVALVAVWVAAAIFNFCGPARA